MKSAQSAKNAIQRKVQGQAGTQARSGRRNNALASAETSGSGPTIAFLPKPVVPVELYPFVVDDNELTVQIIRHSRRGLTRSKLDEIAALARLTNREMAKVLTVSVRTLQDKKGTQVLSTDVSERLLLLEQLLQHGLAVFDGNRELLAGWLRTPLTELSIRDESLPMSATGSTRHLGRFGEPFDLGTTVAEDRQRASQLPVPTPQTPLDLLDTVSGFKLAENVLGRIETGVFS